MPAIGANLGRSIIAVDVHFDPRQGGARSDDFKVFCEIFSGLREGRSPGWSRRLAMARAGGSQSCLL